MGLVKDLFITFGGLAAILAVGGGLYTFFNYFTKNMNISILATTICFIAIYLAVQYKHIDSQIDKKVKEYVRKKGAVNLLTLLLVAILILLIIMFIIITGWGGILWL